MSAREDARERLIDAGCEAFADNAVRTQAARVRLIVDALFASPDDLLTALGMERVDIHWDEGPDAVPVWRYPEAATFGEAPAVP